MNLRREMLLLEMCLQAESLRLKGLLLLSNSLRIMNHLLTSHLHIREHQNQKHNRDLSPSLTLTAINLREELTICQPKPQELNVGEGMTSLTSLQKLSKMLNPKLSVLLQVIFVNVPHVNVPLTMMPILNTLKFVRKYLCKREKHLMLQNKEWLVMSIKS